MYFGAVPETFSDANKGSFSYLSGLAKAVLWIVGIIVCCERMGFDTKAAVTSMGIVSVAAGLALQATFKNMLGTWAIMTDKVMPCILTNKRCYIYICLRTLLYLYAALPSW